MAIDIGRRQFVSALSVAAAGWTLAAANAQQAGSMRRIGVLIGNASHANDSLGQNELEPFRVAMRDAGWIEGSTIQIEYRFGASDPVKIQAAAVDLVALAPDLIYAITLKAAQSVSQKTHRIPIVFSLVADPVGMGLVKSLNHPGGNITGFEGWGPATAGKWLQLLKEISPGIAHVGIIYNPDVAPYAASLIAAAGEAGQGLDLQEYPIRDDHDVTAAAMSLAREPHGALWVIGDPFTFEHADHINAEALRFRLPAVFGNRVAVERGGLISYSNDWDADMRQAVSYIDRILRGGRPADLPVQTPVKYELVINLKTAKALDLTVPATLLAIANKVIE